MAQYDERDLLSSSMLGEDEQDELSLRPHYLNEYIGQGEVKEHMRIYINAAKQRQDTLDHTLLYGPPGLGKTTLANIIANEMGANIHKTSGPVLARAGDLASILTKLEEGDILFIDEIHRLSPSVEEILYPAMEDFKVDIMIGKGPGARSIQLDIARFTLVGATTRMGLLTSPLRDRFGIKERLEMYHVDDLVNIITRSADILGAKIRPDAAREIAMRSRGTPRIAIRLMRRVRDYAQVKGDGEITLGLARAGLDMLKIDELGLDTTDIRLLTAMIKTFSGRAVGLETLAAATGEDPRTIEDVYEPFLIRLGFIERTPRGRIPLKNAYEHLGIQNITD